MTRKVVAFVLLYGFYASSLWAFTPGQYLPLAGGAHASLRHAVSLPPVNSQNLPLASHSISRPARVFSNISALASAPNLTQATGGPATGASTTINFFGPEEYVRTTGSPNNYSASVQVPAWITSPFDMHIENGDSTGAYRVSVSSASITVNGVQ